jgi:hypothetical protein
MVPPGQLPLYLYETRFRSNDQLKDLFTLFHDGLVKPVSIV